MTQKELLYFEDAIKHEENTIKIIDSCIKTLKDKQIIEFMNNEKKIHNKMKNELLKNLEVIYSE